MREAKFKTPWLATAALTMIGAFLSTTAFAGINRWTGSGPHDVSVTSLAIDPLNPERVYAGAFREVYRSRNGGLSWTLCLLTSSREETPSRLAIDALSPSSVYAATSEGLFKSTDAGSNWVASPGLSHKLAWSLALDPATPSTVYVGTQDGLLKSTDGGVNWSGRLLAASIFTLLFSREKPPTIFGADFDAPYYPSSPPSMLYKSTDDGKTWSQNNTGIFISPGVLAIDPTSPSILYAGTWYGVYKSGDSGSTWRSSGLQDLGVNAVVVDPLNPSTVYVGTPKGVFRSADAGASWHEFNTGLNDHDYSIFALAIDRTGTRLHAGTYKYGVFDYQIVSGALDLSAGRGNETRVVIGDVDGRVVFRGVDSSGSSTSSPSYGPFSGWYPIALASGPDDLTRVLWKNFDESVALWLLRPEGVQASFRYEVLPGLTASDVAAGAGSDTHVLWTGADGAVVLQTIEASGVVTRSLSVGPYSGWRATAIADGPDGLTRVLWNNDDGRSGLSLVSSDGTLTTARYESAAGWTTLDVAVGSDGLTRILRAHEDGRFALRVADAAGKITTDGAVYPAPEGMTARHIAAGPDGSSRVLFTNPRGDAALGLLSAAGAYQGLVSLTVNFPLAPDLDAHGVRLEHRVLVGATFSFVDE